MAISRTGRRVRGGFRTAEFCRGAGHVRACGLLSAAPGLYVTGSGRGRTVRVHALTRGERR